jgi:hypothetical protein
MAYFSNSSEGCALDAICDKCVHIGPQDGPGCSVLFMQLDWNYEQGGGTEKDTAEEKTKREALNSLISHDDEGKLTCKMFFPVEWLSDRGQFEIGKADKSAQDRLKLKEWNKIYAK